MPVSKSKVESTAERRVSDRRETEDRRSQEAPVAEERRKGHRRKVQRRRQIDPTTCERDYTAEEIEFMQAMDAYKRSSGRMFPTCSEILEVLRDLGYRKVDADAVPPATAVEAIAPPQPSTPETTEAAAASLAASTAEDHAGDEPTASGRDDAR